MFIFTGWGKIRKWQSQIMEFMAGKQQRTAGKVQVLSLIDVFVDTAEEAGQISRSLQQIISRRSKGTKASFKYEYDRVGHRARFLLEGSPEYVNSMLQDLEK